MQLHPLLNRLSDPGQIRQWLSTLGITEWASSEASIRRMAEAGISADLFSNMIEQMERAIPAASDPAAALANLERFLHASRSPQSLASLFERDPETLPTLIQMFSISQNLAEQLIRDPESFDFLRLTEGQPVSRSILLDEICNEVSVATDEARVMRILRAHKQRETMRIAYGDFVGNTPLEVVTEQLSFVADAIIQAATQAARREQESKRGCPMRPDGQIARFAVIATGRLGGSELNYSNEVELLFVADLDGQTDHPRPIPNVEFFERMARQVVRLLTDGTTPIYNIDMRLRPQGPNGPLVIAPTAALHYYDTAGRTWERQAWVKARSAAGDIDIGLELIERLQGWIYRRYLTRADISGIRALKRRIEKRAQQEGDAERNVKTGRGGIQDIEFVIQFLQLLNGGDLPPIRCGNTLKAISSLEQVGCLTMQERSYLEENYRFLRRIEHLLQIIYDANTQNLPDDAAELRRLALRAGYRDEKNRSALIAFQEELHERTDLNRRMLDHMLHDAFGNEEDIPPEADLILDPQPEPATITSVLDKYGFRDSQQAYRYLQDLSRETVSFLSTRRCRHFLAAISPKLLSGIAATPDADMTLMNLTRISDSLGGKAVLWELFSFNPPSMDLCLRLCGCSPYLVSILTSSPGMIDELMDSLMVDRMPSIDRLDDYLAEMCRGAEDIEPILHSFKNTMHLRVGVRDILGKEDITSTHEALSDIAEVCLRQVIQVEYHRLVQRYGIPTIDDGTKNGRSCELAVLALGKLGGREPNYHSDLDVIFLFEADGQTRSLLPGRRRDETSNVHFFNQLSQRIIQTVTRLTPFGRLFDIDTRLRPTGKTGTLAMSVTDLVHYFSDGGGQLWERLALCKARAVWGSPAVKEQAIAAVTTIMDQHPWSPDQAKQIYEMRLHLQEGASHANLKRGAGGTVDIEFIVQMLQLKYRQDHPDVETPGTLGAIDRLKGVKALTDQAAGELYDGYQFLRSIESGLRLMNTTARHDLPSDPAELKKLAFLIGYQDGEPLEVRVERTRNRNRALFKQIFADNSV